jgi:hypothetical protein
VTTAIEMTLREKADLDSGEFSCVIDSVVIIP